MSTHSRPERVAQMVQQCLGEIFARGIRDPRVGLVTITGAKISPDLRQARVYWTVHGGAANQKSTAAGLEAAKSYLRQQVGKQLGMRVVPDLSFTYDEAIDRGDRIDQLLREAKASDTRLAAEARAPVPLADERIGETASEALATSGADAPTDAADASSSKPPDDAASPKSKVQSPKPPSSVP